MVGDVSTNDGYDRLKRDRDLVRRTALLLSANLPLHELFEQVASLLATYVDASIVQVAVGDDRDARIEFIFREGKGGRPDDARAHPEGLNIRVLRTGKPILLNGVEEWPHARVVTLGDREVQRAASAVFVPIPFGGRIVGVLSIQSGKPNAYDDEDLLLLESCAIYLGARIHDEEQRAATEQLQHIATTDALTGLANRRAFDEALAREWHRCGRSRTPLSLLMVDVDYFKTFNDAYGHVAGDTCLRQIAQSVAACAKRPGDVAARYGGEEFSIVLPETDVERAAQLAEHMCDAVRGLAIPHQGSSLGHVTISVGVASMQPEGLPNPQELIERADAQLYRAKGTGRNRVVAQAHESEAPHAQPKVIVRHNLPAARTSFVGRDHEIGAIGARLASGRLVTIAGPGGAGKTRVALEFGRRSVELYPDGVWFVDLTTVTDAGGVAHAIAAAVFSAMNAAVDSARLIDLLRSKQLLLILDNCEHIVDACARVVDELLDAVPELRVVATSREPLAINGESVHRLLPLERDEGARLFVERASHAGRIDTPLEEGIVARIVAQLEGMPLAIELAAMRVAVMPPEELLQRLNDRLGVLRSKNRLAPSRQQTLQALLDWSYQLLTPEEQTVFRRLAVFVGGWTRDGAVAVCAGSGLTESEVADAVEALVAKSLAFQVDTPSARRFRFLESTHEYALAALSASGEIEMLEQRHAEYFTVFAEANAVLHIGQPFDRWNDTHRVEFDNYRAAIRWCFDTSRDHECAARLLYPLRSIMEEYGPVEFTEIIPRIEGALANDALTVWAQAVLWEIHCLLVYRTDSQLALQGAETALELFRSLGDRLGAASSLWDLASAQIQASGGVDEALEAEMSAGLAVARESRDARLASGYLIAISAMILNAGRLSEARAALVEGAKITDRDDVVRRAVMLNNTAEIEMQLGAYEKAVSLGREAVALTEELRPWIAAIVLVTVGLGELKLGNSTSSRVALLKALTALRAYDNEYWIAAVFDALAQLALHTGELERSARLSGFAQASYERGPVRQLVQQGFFDECLAALRERLHPAAFDREWDYGCAMSIDEACSLAEEN
jgi:diguanylate cyclase (GGDEF)-like protein